MALSQIEETSRDLSMHALNVLGVEVDALNIQGWLQRMWGEWMQHSFWYR